MVRNIIRNNIENTVGCRMLFPLLLSSRLGQGVDTTTYALVVPMETPRFGESLTETYRFRRKQADGTRCQGLESESCCGPSRIFW